MKHEKALIVVLAYIIGFTTAFIGFGLPGQQNLTTDDSLVVLEDFTSKPIASAYVDEMGLFAKTQQGSVIISAQDQTLTEEKNGYHYDIHLATVSPNGEFIHYCQQSLEVPTDCVHYVYVASEHEVWPVTIAGEHLVSTDTEVRNSWNSDSTLTIAGTTSVSPSTPWELQ